MQFTHSHLEQILNPALRTFFGNDSYLLENDVNELSITHKLAAYVEQELSGRLEEWGVTSPKYAVDCEFNRERDDVKRLPFTHYLSNDREQLYAPCPDIIIHERGNNDHNAVVIEVKKWSGRLGHHEQFLRSLDFLKLACYLQSPLNYGCGLFLVFATESPFTLHEAKHLEGKDRVRVDDKKRLQLQSDLQDVWTQIRESDNSKKREIEEQAIALSKQIMFEDVLGKSGIELAWLGS